MQLSSAGHPHLTYCTNIHPGETWAEVRANLERYVLAVRREVAPDRRFGVGLRLSAQAAATLAEPAELEAFRGFLATHGLYVFTINGFPYGVFHGARVKEEVYRPAWTDEARLVYTDRLAELLAVLLPDEPDLDGSVSTVPGAFKARVAGDADAARMAELLLRHAATLARVRERTGKIVCLALEPEPCCHLETVAETVAFFERHLFSRAAAERLARRASGESTSTCRSSASAWAGSSIRRGTCASCWRGSVARRPADTSRSRRTRGTCSPRSTVERASWTPWPARCGGSSTG